MANQIFMRVDEVAEELGVSVPYAYKLIRQMNEELAKTGCITISGRIDRKFFHEKFYRICWEQHRSDGIWRFGRTDDQFSVLPRDAFVDRKRTVLNIQVLPSQG